MVDVFRPLSRGQIAKIVGNDAEAIRAFETLFQQAGIILPGEVAGVSADAGLDVGTLNGRISELLAVQTEFMDSVSIVFVNYAADFPAAVDGVITLLDDTTYWVSGDIDLNGARIVAGQGTVIIGPSSESATIRSTGLLGALVASQWSLPIRDVTFDAVHIFDLDATDNDGQALDWAGVNVANTTNIGTIKNYGNFVARSMAFLGASGLVFDGEIGTVAMSDTLFSSASTGTVITIPDTATISRRFRITYSSLIANDTATAIDVSTSATVPIEGYILDTCNFSGDGTSLAGVQNTDNKALFTNNKGISNSATISNYYMTGNATETTIATTDTPVKAAGVTTSDSITQRFTNTDNRATYIGAVSITAKVTAFSSMASNNNVQMALFVAKNGTVIDQSEGHGVANSGGKSDTTPSQAIVTLETGDYIEVWTANQSNTQDITLENLNVVIERSGAD